MNDLSPQNIINNNLLTEALINVRRIKKGYELELINNYSDELLEKIIGIDEIIKEAEKVITLTASEGSYYFKEKHPDKVDLDGNLNEKGIQRLNFLKRKWFKFNWS